MTACEERSLLRGVFRICLFLVPDFCAVLFVQLFYSETTPIIRSESACVNNFLVESLGKKYHVFLYSGSTIYR